MTDNLARARAIWGEKSKDDLLRIIAGTHEFLEEVRSGAMDCAEFFRAESLRHVKGTVEFDLACGRASMFESLSGRALLLMPIADDEVDETILVLRESYDATAAIVDGPPGAALAEPGPTVESLTRETAASRGDIINPEDC